MKQLIEEQTAIAKKIYTKSEELKEVRQKIDAINNIDFFEMTFDEYANRTSMIEYYGAQSQKLISYQNNLNNNLRGKFENQIGEHIRKLTDSDDDVSEAFRQFELKPNNDELKKVYNELFNEKVNRLHEEALDLLSEYLNTKNDDEKRVFKAYLKQALPKPITAMEIETYQEGRRKGYSTASYDKRVNVR